MSGITLSSSQRSSLLNLQETDRLAQRTTLRLATGRSVNSVADNAVNFFRSRSLANRASDFADRKSDISQGISSINSALEGTDAIDSLLKQLQGVIEGTRSASQTERKVATNQFFDIIGQISNVIEDATYQGLNLLNNSNNKLSVNFSDRSQSQLQVVGYGLNSNRSTASERSLFTGIAGSTLFKADGQVVTGTAARASVFEALGYKVANAGGFTNIGQNSSNVDQVNGLVDTVKKSIEKNRSIGTQLGNSASVLKTRLDFTSRYISRLQSGSDDLVLADLNEEGANLLALQTRQQLGINALSLASQQQQSILQLIR